MQRTTIGDLAALLAYTDRGPTRQRWVGQRLPSGRRMTRPQWQNFTRRLIRAKLASRTHSTAPLALIGDYRTALTTFRELL